MGGKLCCAKERKSGRPPEPPGCLERCCCGEETESSGSDSGSDSSSSSSSSSDSDEVRAGETPGLRRRSTNKKKRATEGAWDMDKAAKRADEAEKREETHEKKQQKIKSSLGKALQAVKTAPSATSSGELLLALKTARSAGFTERDPNIKAAVKQLSQREDAARKALKQAVRTKKFTVLKAAVEEAHALGLECEELEPAETLLLKEKQRLLASAKITAPVSNRDIAMLWRRVSRQSILSTGEVEQIAPEVAGMDGLQNEESNAEARVRDNLTEQSELAALQEEVEEAVAAQASSEEQRKVTAMYGLATSALQRDVGKLQEAIKEGFDAGLQAKEMQPALAVLALEQKKLEARPSVDGTPGSSMDSLAPGQDSITASLVANPQQSVKRDSFGPLSKRGASLPQQLPSVGSSAAQPFTMPSLDSTSPTEGARLLHHDVREVNFGAFRGSSIGSTAESSSYDAGSRRSSSVSNRTSFTTHMLDGARAVSLHEYNPAAVRRASGSRSMPPSHRISTDWRYEDSQAAKPPPISATSAVADAASSADDVKRNSKLVEMD